jgi:hypothetical protein
MSFGSLKEHSSIGKSRLQSVTIWPPAVSQALRGVRILVPVFRLRIADAWALCDNKTEVKIATTVQGRLWVGNDRQGHTPYLRQCRFYVAFSGAKDHPLDTVQRGTKRRTFVFVTYENRRNPHVTVHRDGCGQIRKRGGTHKYAQGNYKNHDSFTKAVAYAKSTGLPIVNCSYCKPS